MSKHAAWLRQELAHWLQDGLIDEATATAIIKRYPETAGSSRVLFILSGIGSLIIGLGVILFFAYNWAAMPKVAKLALIFAGLLLSHALALWLRRKPGEHANLIEGFHLLGTMMFGAGIWLIAQIYHMDEHYPTALLLWGLGGLSLAWAIPSVIQGLLATLLISAWGLAETMDFNRIHLSSISLLALTLLPLAWLQRSRTLLAVTLLSLLSLTLLNIGAHWTFSIVLKLLFCSALAMLAAAHWSKHSHFPQSATVFKGIGALIYGACLLYMSFDSEFLRYQVTLANIPTDSEWWYLLVNRSVLAVTAALWLLVLFSSRSRGSVEPPDRILEWQRILVMISLLILTAYQFAAMHEFTTSLVLASNAVLAAHGVLLIIRGTDRLQWWLVTLGFMTLCVLIMARFGDLFESLLLRSLAFILVGALLFLVGQRYSARKLREQLDA